MNEYSPAEVGIHQVSALHLDHQAISKRLVYAHIKRCSGLIVHIGGATWGDQDELGTADVEAGVHAQASVGMGVIQNAIDDVG